MSYFGLNPRVRQSGDGHAHHGRISFFTRIMRKRGKPIAAVATARKITDGGDQPDRNRQIDAGDCHQSPSALITEGSLGHDLVDLLKVNAEMVELFQPTMTA